MVRDDEKRLIRLILMSFMILIEVHARRARFKRCAPR